MILIQTVVVIGVSVLSVAGAYTWMMVGAEGGKYWPEIPWFLRISLVVFSFEVLWVILYFLILNFLKLFFPMDSP